MSELTCMTSDTRTMFLANHDMYNVTRYNFITINIEMSGHAAH